jgi:hypothetical protein
MVALNIPVGSLFLLIGQKWSSAGHQLLSNLGQEFQNLNDALVIHLWGQLCEGTDEWLEQSVFAFHQFGLHLLESALELGERNTCLEMLYDLGGFIDGVDLVNMLCILSLPCCVLWGSIGWFVGKAFLVAGDVGGHDSYFGFSFTQGLCGWVSQVGKGHNLALVIGDFLF